VLLYWKARYEVCAMAAQRGREGVDLKPSRCLLHLCVSTVSTMEVSFLR
jgi:hypothetical protein